MSEQAKNIIGEMNRVFREIQARWSERAQQACAEARCPQCEGACVQAAPMSFGEFNELGVAIRERLVGRCAAGHEWAVDDPAFRWETPP